MTKYGKNDARENRPNSSEPQQPDLPADGHMTTQDIQDAYASHAKWIDRLSWVNRWLTGRYRRRQFGEAEGRVLDVACGAGTNFRYLPESTEIVGIDISEPLLQQARTELETLERRGTVEQMDAEALDFEDDSFETVISSFSTCTFPNPVAALQEMARVCRPEGEILLLEHGRSDNTLLARYQEWRADAHYETSGCRLTHEPVEVVRQAGLSVEEVQTAQFGRITRITCNGRESNGTEAGR
jgi:ubiquinone/menaquinone biosynthesis C-methylase UbiE